MKGSPAHARRKKKQILLSILIGLVICGLAAVGVYAAANREGVLNKTTLCPETGPTGHVVLLVDKTDPLNFTQKQAFHTFLEDLAGQGVPPGQLLSVFVLGEDYTATATPLLELCNPGDGHDKSTLTANPKKLKKQFEQRFREPVLKLVDQLQATEPAKYSPIFEMVQLASINGFRKQHVDGPRRLYIVSDLMHNTPQYSMYHSDYRFESFIDSAYGRKMTADLKGVDVELQYILNAPQLQTRRHLKFWEDYFTQSGARIAAVRPLEG